MPVRTMVVWCPDWPVVAAGVPLDEPSAVVAANLVIAASPAARIDGVRRGLRRRDAQARCPSLRVLERDEAGEARAFEPLVAAVETFCPRIEITRPGTCAFPTRGPSRYFGGDEALARRVQQAVVDAGSYRGPPSGGGCRVGAADGPFAATLAARRVFDGPAGDAEPHIVPPGGTAGFLAPLPVTNLERPELTDVLVRLGVCTLGELASLSRADLIARFGWEGEGAHRLACGLDERQPATRPPPTDLSVSAELDPPADRVETAAFVAKSLADRLHERLAAEGLACVRVSIEAETEHGERLERLWRHEGALDAAAIADRARWQLDGWLTGTARAGRAGDQEAWSTRPTGAIALLRLVPDEVTPGRGRQLGFWGNEAAADERAMRSLARVQGLLGPEAVLVPERAGGRGPGEQVITVPADTVDLTEPRPLGDPSAPWPGRVPPPSPAVVWPDPVPAEVVDEVGRPVVVDGRGWVSHAPFRVSVDGGQWQGIGAWAGPWPVDERWWDLDAHRRRARFQVVADDSTAYLLAVEGGRWWLEATYD